MHLPLQKTENTAGVGAHENLESMMISCCSGKGSDGVTFSNCTWLPGAPSRRSVFFSASMDVNSGAEKGKI